MNLVVGNVSGNPKNEGQGWKRKICTKFELSKNNGYLTSNYNTFYFLKYIIYFLSLLH